MVENQANIQISIIVAAAKNGAIGKNGDLPWRLPSDLKNFKALTIQKPIIMGRKTFESLPKLLPEREHIVISRNADFRPKGAILVSNIENALSFAKAIALEKGQNEICIIGGGEIYALALKFANRIYLTEVDCEISGDTYFPKLDSSWKLTHQSEKTQSEKDEYAFIIKTFDKTA